MKIDEHWNPFLIVFRSQTCDFVENGLCHESPRWVSLLVAEIFYPEAIVPQSSSSSSSRINGGVVKAGGPPPHLPPHHPSFKHTNRSPSFDKCMPIM